MTSRIRHLIACVAAGLLATCLCSSGTAGAATTRVLLDGIRVAVTPTTLEVITVHHTTGTNARVTLWGRTSSGRWLVSLRTSSGRIGSGGLVAGDQRRQGTNTTPTGTYAIPFAFGVDSVPGETYPYRHVTNADWWVEDNASIYYNHWRASRTGFRWWLNSDLVNSSEHLILYRPEYDLGLVIGYNYANPVHYRGAGIFLHVNGSGATEGCVSVPRQFMYNAIHRMRVSAHPVIAIG